MSGSAKRLYKNPSTSSPVSGPPRFRSNTPTLGSFMSASDMSLFTGSAHDDGAPLPKVRAVAASNFIRDGAPDFRGGCSENPAT